MQGANPVAKRLLPGLPSPKLWSHMPLDTLSNPDHNSQWRQVRPANPYITLPLNEVSLGAVSCYEYTIVDSPVRGSIKAAIVASNTWLGTEKSTWYNGRPTY